MLKIKCHDCGAKLKGIDIIVKPFFNYVQNVKYKDYTTTCSKCGGVIVWDRYAKKAEENKAKALRKKGISMSSPSQYDTIMVKVKKRAKEITQDNGLDKVRLVDLNQAINELPPQEREIVLAYEDKGNVEILNSKCYKSTEQIDISAVLLLNQAIIVDALIDKDIDFFKSNYGGAIVSAYDSALTLYKGCDYNITSELLLEKIENGQVDNILELLKSIHMQSEVVA